MKKTEHAPKARRASASGVIAVVFLILGYQVALFVHHAAVARIASVRDTPDTIYVYKTAAKDSVVSNAVVRKEAVHSPVASKVRTVMPRQKVESFRFNPNTVTVEELCRLGFSHKQALSIDSYRRKGGRFRRKSDFARSYVVSDSIFKRLEPFIDIPLLDLNLADSAALDALPGIGGWFAQKILEHRKALGGFSDKVQLMDIWRFDQEKYEALEDLVTVSEENVRPYPLWSLPADSLRLHPYICNYETARAIVLFRESMPKEACTVKGLAEAGIISTEASVKLSRCVLE